MNQEFVLITCDLQLYKIALDVKWAYPDQFSDVIPRLGGMHSLMSCVGCIGTLMDNSGLSDILNDVFGGVAKMLNGKSFLRTYKHCVCLQRKYSGEYMTTTSLSQKES